MHDPLLLEPGSDRPAFVVVRGLPADELLAGGIDHGGALAALPWLAYVAGVSSNHVIDTPI